MNPDIERATDALIAGHKIEVQGSGLEAAVTKHTSEHRDVYRDFAHAVLSAALSEPSKKMVLAALQGWVDNGGILSASSSPSERLAMRAALVAVGKLFEGRTG